MTEPDDRELQQYLEGDSPLSRRYRAASAETTPPELDEAILARARSELRRRPHGISRWLTPAALAASVMLGINLGWNVYRAAPPPGEVSQSKAVADSPAADAATPPPAAPAEPARQAAPAARERDERRADLEKKRESAALARRQATEQRALAVEEERRADDMGAAVGAAAAPAPQARAPQAAAAAPELSWQDKTTQRRSEATETLPPGWHLYGDGQLYDASIDESTFHSPPSSLAVWRVGPGVERCGRLQTEVPAPPYLGRTVRVTGVVRTQGVAGDNVMLFVSYRRGGQLASPFNVDRFTAPGGQWQREEVRLETPDNAESLVYGALLCGPGQMWLDDIQLSLVNSGSAPTAPAAAPAARAVPVPKPWTEAEKIERLIVFVAGLGDVVFIRNGKEHSAVDASKHMRLKWEKAGDRVKTADDFIRLCASFSSSTGAAYLIRFPDGRTRTAEDILREQVATMP